MDLICITDLLSELEDDAPTQETSAADEQPNDNKDAVENYICTLEDDFDFDELLQQTLTPSTEELLLKTRDGEKAVQPSARRVTELKRIERFGWQRVPDDKSPKRVRYNYIDKSTGQCETSLKRTLEAIRMQTIETAAIDTLYEVTQPVK